MAMHSQATHTDSLNVDTPSRLSQCAMLAGPGLKPQSCSRPRISSSLYSMNLGAQGTHTHGGESLPSQCESRRHVPSTTHSVSCSFTACPP